MDVSTIPDAIQWHEGMLLAPQHFQQSTWRHEALLHYHTMAIAPFHWGIRHAHIEPMLLMHGTLRVVELEAVLPDGLVVVHGPHTQGTLELDLTPYTEDLRHNPRMVYLAVPEYGAGCVAGNGTLVRYASVDGHAVVDANTGEGEVCIPRLQPRLSLVCTDVRPQGYVGFPLAQVHYQNELFALTDFIPPTYTVARHSPLGEMCALIARRLREKAMFLAEQVRSPAAAVSAPLMLETKNLIHSLVAALPPFEALVSTESAHPYALYLAVCALVGQVAGVGTSLVPPVLPVYNHNDLRATFAPAQAFIFRVLDEGVHEDYTTHPFQYADGLFGLTFDRAWMDARLVIGVRGQASMTEREVVAWVEGSVIGASSVLQSMRERRVLGVARQHIERDDNLVPARGVVLFALAADSTYLKPNEVLQICNASGTLRPSEIVLYVRRRP
ncbi:MAG TPA: type VI secretion system baseplate subunit TssK [Candidatus Tectomicrobia bacterium]|jgi:type VI secretion system protein ImpJ